ncbi:MAG: GNAT family N-acetyltransferase [Kutzneria sp.]|nr:GNAT family N-acetyltransferase [Kutzneria sp.]
MRPTHIHQPDDAVEQLGPADAGEVLTLQRAAFVTEAQTHNDPMLPPLLQSLDELRAELDRSTVRAWGIREAGRLIASVRLELDGTVARLGRASVAPDRQGRGVGTRLLRAAEDQVPGTITAIELFTGEHSSANLRLYRRLGYVEFHRSPHGAYELVHMRKDLARPAHPKPTL